MSKNKVKSLVTEAKYDMNVKICTLMKRLPKLQIYNLSYICQGDEKKKRYPLFNSSCLSNFKWRRRCQEN